VLAIDLKGGGFLELGGTSTGLVFGWVRQDFPDLVTLHRRGMGHEGGCLLNCQLLSLLSLSFKLQELEIEFLVWVGRVPSAGHLSTPAPDIYSLETWLMLVHDGRRSSKLVGASSTS
jgi:hypothetical protein